MLKNRIVVADGKDGWDVRLYDLPHARGSYTTLASGLGEEDADNFVAEYRDKVERRAHH